MISSWCRTACTSGDVTGSKWFLARLTVWTVRDGAIKRVVMYQERQDALEALGLSEQDAHAESS